MEFCSGCKGLVYDLPDGERCQPCIDRKNKPPKVTRVPPRPPIQVPTKKSAPKPIGLISHLERIAEYRTKRGSQPLHPTESQKEIIKKIEGCIKNNKNWLVISAPTGCGKSWIAATLASAYGAVILTSTNDLQDQYCGTEQGFDEDKKPGDFKFMNAVRGKSRYLCELSENTITCNEAYCHKCEYKVESLDITIRKGNSLNEEIISKPGKTLCTYYKADEVGKKSDFAVYSYASYIARMKADQFKPAPDSMLPEKAVLICDEAHDYDKVVSDLLTCELDGKLNKQITGKSLPIFSDNEEEPEKIEKTREFIEEIVAKFEQSVDEIKNCAEHARILKSKKHLEMQNTQFQM